MRIRVWVLLIVLALAVNGCMRSNDIEGQKEAEKPKLPDGITLNAEGVPMIRVYDIASEKSEEMDMETYIEGVLAGEMKNDWPEEALKAQAILARTFVLKFIDTKDSRYDGADISTDISEAQAYAEALVNDRIRNAVKDTRGMVASHKGELINAWFHAHSGGITELAQAGLDYKEDPAYLKSVKSPDSESAPEDVKNWTASFTMEEMEKALSEVGVNAKTVTSCEIGKKSDSGRAVTLIVNGKEVSAPSLRIHLGSDKMKSTFLNSVTVTDGGVTFTGKGYGHGVGMSQWGAYAMAESGRNAEDIIHEYFQDVDIVKMWN